MSELMIRLRRSPRKLLKRDGHPGPGPGRLAVVLARAGVGKTAFLVGIGIDALLSGQKVLHVSLESTVDKIRTWYDDVLMEMLRREKKLAQRAAIQLDVERRRHIHTWVGHSFSVDRLRETLDLLGRAMDFVPQVIIFDQLEHEGFDQETVGAVKSLAAELGAELWMEVPTQRAGPQAAPGHLPPPADRIEELVDLAFRLDSHESKVRLHVLKDHHRMLDEDLNVVLDPQTLLLTTGFSVAH